MNTKEGKDTRIVLDAEKLLRECHKGNRRAKDILALIRPDNREMEAFCKDQVEDGFLRAGDTDDFLVLTKQRFREITTLLRLDPETMTQHTRKELEISLEREAISTIRFEKFIEDLKNIATSGLPRDLKSVPTSELNIGAPTFTLIVLAEHELASKEENIQMPQQAAAIALAAWLNGDKKIGELLSTADGGYSLKRLGALVKSAFKPISAADKIKHERGQKIAEEIFNIIKNAIHSSNPETREKGISLAAIMVSLFKR